MSIGIERTIKNKTTPIVNKSLPVSFIFFTNYMIKNLTYKFCAIIDEKIVLVK